MILILIPGLIIIALTLAICVYQYRMFQHPKPPEIIHNKKHIACVGDSITFGAGVYRERERKAYPAVLQKLVADNYQVLNYGLSGRALMSSADISYQRESFYQISLALKADVYIIMLGTNDAKEINWDEEQYRIQLKEFVNIFHLTRKDTVLFLMCPTRSFPETKTGKIRFGISNDVIKNRIRNIVKETAEELDVACIDLYAYTENHPEWFDDGIHPNAEGNDQIAAYIYQNIKNQL